MDEKRFGQARLIAVAMLVAAPIIYLVLAMFLVKPTGTDTSGEIDLVFYIFLIVSVVQLVTPFLVERFQIRAFGVRPPSQTASQLLYGIAIMKAAIVEAIFIFGLVVYFMSGDLTRMMWFYPIGIVGAAIHWPRRERWISQLKTLERP